MIIAIISTYNREELLITRAIPSIAQQSKIPDIVIIVNDSKIPLSEKTLDAVSGLLDTKAQVVFLENNRTSGASGAWNSAIAYCANRVDQQSTFLAILDDDDEWQSNHIETCAQYLTTHQLIISGLIRKTLKPEPSEIKEPIPSQLNEMDFLIGNPGLQGSNIFIELELIIHVGMFNEHMICSTDRDLCIRLCELSPRVIATDIHTVIHYADSDRNRLTSPSHPQRKEGMQRFYDTYLPRMNSKVRTKSLTRAKQIFDFDYAEATAHISADELQKTPFPAPPINLTVGIICGHWQQVELLLADLLHLQSSSLIESLNVILLENSAANEAIEGYERVIKKFSVHSIFIDKLMQSEDAKNSLFEGINHRNNAQLSIAKARTMLQTYCYHSSKENPGTITWILDDDMRIHSKVYKYLPWLNAFKQQGVDALIGNYEGGSPNPSLNALRVQLIDLNANLKWLSTLDDQSPLPNKESINIKNRQLYPDYYYDHSSKSYGHLENPVWLTPAFHNETVAQAKDRLLSNLHKIITGEAYLRPLISRWPIDPLKEAVSSSNRGGHTFIFNHQLLVNTPNPSLQANGIDLRRSDMLWALINRKIYGANIKFVNFPIYHDRKTNGETSFDLIKSFSEL